MNRLLSVLAIIAILSINTTAYAGQTTTGRPMDVGDVVLETMVLRPAGVVATIVGAAFFVATIPLTALATIPEPHEAFQNAADNFVVKPARWTFVRPFGVYEYAEDPGQ